MSIKVLIIDDSALIRQLLTELLSSEVDIEVVGTAADPLIARDKIKSLNPDVITLDIEMPRMNGLCFLERLMALRPMPVVVISTLTQRGTDTALRALEIGAVEVLPKPMLDVKSGVTLLQQELVAKVRAAALTRPRARSPAHQRPALSLDPDRSPSISDRIVAVGASTGGVEAVQRLLTGLPAHAPPILITQHMPPGFTASFARRLDTLCRMSVHEASQGQTVLPGHVYIAKGNEHLEIERSGSNYVCRLHDDLPVSGHRPSVDVLFRSMATCVGANALGIILTGMGRDGAAGLLQMRKAGARTLGENEASCIIYGMSKSAKEIDALDAELPLNRIAEEIIS